MVLKRYKMSVEFVLEVDDLDPETVQRRVGDLEIEPERWEDVEQERRILRALAEDKETMLRYARNMALDLMEWDDDAGRWRSGVTQMADRLRAKEDYDDLLRIAAKEAPADVGRLLERLIADSIERGIGFPALTELEESFRLTLEKAEFVEAELREDEGAR